MHALVTGGGGFLGSSIVRRLLERGDTVTVLARSEYPELTALGAKSIQHDLRNARGLREHLESVDVLFHTAAKAGVWGSQEEYWSINFQGTVNLHEAALHAGVKKFIYTSSPSAVWSGHDEEGLKEEDCPYPESFLAHYPESKCAAERYILQSSSPALPTTALRPHLIYGPGDPHLVPRLLARASRLRIVGSGKNKVGLTYVDNAAHAHILAADRLGSGSPNAGKGYFITDPEPVLLWDWINSLLTALEKRPVRKKIGARTAYVLGAILELIWKVFRKKGEPPMTRFVARQLATSHYYDLSAARRDFGYEAAVGQEEAWEATVSHFRES